MVHHVLENLRTDEFAVRFSLVSNLRAVHRALQRSKEVEELRSALCTGEVTEETLSVFTTSLLKDFEGGKRFPHELALAAVAVALETRPTPFAEEFVLDLARLELAELPIAIRVARKACQERLAVSASKTKIVPLVGEEALSAGWQKAPECRRVFVSQSEERFELGV